MTHPLLKRNDRAVGGGIIKSSVHRRKENYWESVRIVMYFQSTGRNQRPRGFHVNQGFLLMLISAICIWLLYQIKNSNYTKDDRSLLAKFSKGNSVLNLGRKGDVELSDKTMYMSDSKDVILEAGGKQKDRGGVDDELDGSVDEKGENESLDKRIEYIHGRDKTDAEEGKKMEPERQYHLSTNSENIEIEMRDEDNKIFSEDNSQEGLESLKRIVSNLDGGRYEKDQKRLSSSDERGHKSGANNLVERGDEKDLERHTKELQRDEEISIDALKQGKDEEKGSSRENGEDKDLISKEINKQVNSTENATVFGQNEVGNGLHGFHDENGVPQGSNDLVEFTLAKSRDSQANNILHQETNSSLNHRNNITERPHIKEVESKSDRNATDAETKTRSQKEGSKSDAMLDVGINSNTNF
ncbi:hypothetical protein QQP08_027406 [Theobroma cacao]|nr:hypothetical protein QQP08_027406 [Theobroma cacao]